MTNRNHSFSLSLTLTMPMLLFASLAFGQITNVTDDQSTPTPGAGHDYIKMVNESVNPANGSVSIRIGTPVPKSVGITIPFSFAYDSNGVNHLVPTSSGANPLMFSSNTSFLSQSGWAYSVPMVSQVMQSRPWAGPPQEPCTFFNDFVFQDPTGGRHALYVAYANNTQDGCNRQGIITTPAFHEDYYYATQPVNSVAVAPGITLYDADATKYSFSFAYGHLTNSGGVLGYSALPDTIIDRNGNTATFTDSGNGAFTITDTSQRAAIVSNGFGSSGNTIGISGLTGSYTANWTIWPFSGYDTGLTKLGNGSMCASTVPVLPSSENVISSISLPNGQSYQFSYDPVTGLLQKMTYPTGGYVRYVWQIQGNWQIAESVNINGQANQCAYSYGVPMVSDRFVSYDGNNEVLHQTFAYSVTWSQQFVGWSDKKTTVTTIDTTPGKGAPQFSTLYDYSYQTIGEPYYDVGIVANQVPVENTVTYKDWSTNGGGVLRTETKAWWDQYLLGCDQTTLGPSGPSSAILYFYQTSSLFSQMLEKDEYDFGTACPSSLSPLPAPTASLLTQTQYHYSQIGSTGIADRPDIVTVNGVISPGNTGEASQVVYSYDQNNGNTLSKTEKCLYNCTSDRATIYTYWPTGQVDTMKDPNLNITSYLYQPCAYTTPYVSQITYPTTSSNGVAHALEFEYNCASGSLTQSSDENSNITLYDYTDPLGRLKKITYPDTGQTTYTYNDGPPTPSIETDKLIDSTHTRTTVQTFDGLGHTTKSQITAPEGPILVTTTYDGTGQPWTVTNPQYSTSSPSDGTTTYVYDALGRTLSTKNPDTTTATNSYSGNSITAIDAGGISHTFLDDALGRLSSVTENGLNYVTTYPNYNAMDGLLTVNQGGQTRSFTYDSFSGLHTATNPENGTITYGYDGNGNVLTKTDARGTTTYSYDELNRVLYKTYTDTSTVRACYAYDGVYGWGGTTVNPVGRLTSSWSVQHDGTVVSANESYQWDAMGRLQAGLQCTPATCGASSYPLSAVYNLSGNETSLVDSTVTRTSSYDTADRLTAFTGTLPGMGTQTLLNVTTFGPVGLVTAKLGTGSGMLTETRGYNNRTWLGSLTVSNSTYTLGLGYYGNGDVHTANDSVNGNWTYTYDASNRLRTASVTGQSFTYTPDQYGNMTCTNTGSKPCTPLGLSFNALNNQITTSGYSYDGAGNLLTDNTHGYVYDAENRIRCVWGTDGTCTSSTATLYFYDAQGQRVGKQQANTLEDYVYDPQGDIISVHDGNVNLLRTDLYTGGRHVASFAPNPNGQYSDPYPSGLFWNHADWLGTERVRTTSAGAVYESCIDNPYGMNLSCVGTSDASPMHFAGKQRDNETGLDYFGARYLASGTNLGRFMTPDWSEKPTAVPYAMFGDPQSLNLYSYTRNNPLLKADEDGHCPQCLGALVGAAAGATSILVQTAKVVITGKGTIPSNRQIAGAIIGGAVGGALAPTSGGLLTGVVSKGGIVAVAEQTATQRVMQSAVSGVVGGAVNTAISTGDGNRVADASSVATNAGTAAGGNLLTGAIMSSTQLSANTNYMSNLPASPSLTGTAATDALAYGNTARTMSDQLSNQTTAAAAAIKTVTAGVSAIARSNGGQTACPASGCGN